MFGEHVESPDIATVVARSLLTANQAGFYLASRPLHLIGHSRGGSVVLETAKILGSYGIWVDHITTLDPHPLTDQDLFYVFFTTQPDPSAILYENVVFADNYWRTPEYPSGQTIVGSEDISLDDSKFGILDPPHSDVHSWYHGTIYTDGGYPINDGLNGVGGANIPDSWYTPSNPARNGSGFAFSRIENNFLHYRPAFSYAIGQAFGGHAQRATTSRAGGAQWANIGQVQILPAYPNNAYPQGQPVTATFKYQDRDSGVRVEWFMDTDKNPFNNTGGPVVVQTFDSTGDKVSSGTVNIPTVGLSVGITRRLLAKITSLNNNAVRYEYADSTFLITWPEFGLQSITPDSVVAGAGVTRLTLHGSAFAPSDKVLFFNGTTTTPVTPVSVAADQIVVDFNFGSTLRTWSLSVQQYIDILPYRTSESLPVEVRSSTPAGPLITQQPADATVSFGHTTNFTVAATGAGTLAYQWQRNGQDISGATNTSYTTSPVTYANDGFTYQAFVSDANGTTISRLATLNVVSQISTCNDPMEPNDHSYQATILPLGVVTNGLICSPSDIDWFKVTLVTNGLLNLSLVVPSGLDFDLELYGTNLAWAAGSYNAAGQNESIQQTLPAGDYYVRVYGYPAGNGSYSQTQPYQLSANASEVRPPGPLSGYITNDVSWSGVVEVTGDVTIVGGGSLTILPGTQVRCAGGDDRSSGNDSSRVEIILNGGTLNASGTVDAPIRFTSRAASPVPGDWYGIRLVQGSVSLSHFLIEFAVMGLRLEDSDTRFDSYTIEHGAIRNSRDYAFYQNGSQGTVELDDLSITNNASGLYTGGPLLVRDSRFNRNTGSGILGDSYSLTLTNCDVSTNGSYGIQVSSKALVVQNCTIQANQTYGLYAAYGSVEVRNSQIQRNYGTGVYLPRPSPVTLVGNTISQNTGQGVLLNFDGGSVSAEGITNNVIRNNDVGVQVYGSALSVLNLSGNDIYQNLTFELRNDSSISITANNCYWGEPTATEWTAGQVNLSRIYDLHDNASVGQVLVTSIRGAATQNTLHFTQQPQSVMANIGDTVILSPLVAGSGTISYQWFDNGLPLAQATNLSLTLANVNVGNSGGYYLVISNATGVASSSVAFVAVILPPGAPTISQQPQPRSVLAGSPVSFTVVAAGNGPFGYQWQKDSVAINGATSSTYTIAAVTVNDTGAYSVIVTNSGGSTPSQAATLTVNVLLGSAINRTITTNGSNFAVSLVVSPPVGTPAYMVEEVLPAGFSPNNISSSGSWDAASRTITWGPFWDGLPRSFTYTLIPPSGFSGTAALNGQALLFGATATTGGDSNVTVGPPPMKPVLALVKIATGLYGASVTGEIGRTYRIDATDGLGSGTWTPVTTVVVTQSPFTVADLGSIGKPMRFYRAVVIQ